MEVTNITTAQNYNYNSTKTQEVKTTPSTFDSLLEEQKEVPEKKESRFLANIDKYNLFEDLSEDEKKRFREILADDTLSLEELDTLSYEEAKRFFSHMHPKNVESLDELPLLKYSGNNNQIMSMASSINMSNDENFNKAMYKTHREITSEEQRDVFSSTLLFEEANRRVDRGEYTFDYIEVNDGKSFIYNLLSNLETEYSQNQDLRTKMLLDSYTLLQKNYNEVLNEKKEIYA